MPEGELEQVCLCYCEIYSSIFCPCHIVNIFSTHQTCLEGFHFVLMVARLSVGHVCHHVFDLTFVISNFSV